MMKIIDKLMLCEKEDYRIALLDAILKSLNEQG